MRYDSHQMVLLLGSNIQPQHNLPKAVALLSERFDILAISSVWESAAIGSDGPNFLNAAILLESKLAPQTMKDFVLRPLEASLGRVRVHDKNAPRTIDLDVVIWGKHTWDAEIWQHAHAAVPVAELLPDFRTSPEGPSLQQAAKQLQVESEIRLQPEITQQIKALSEASSYFSFPLPMGSLTDVRTGS
jgi:2-amino-4-hydroxy-6-hydroxymethyldihydropteridine diphosphokinase